MSSIVLKFASWKKPNDIFKKKWGKQYADKIETLGIVAIGIYPNF